MILLLENKIRGGISPVMGDRYVKQDENKKILNIDAINLSGHSVSQHLPYDESKLDRNVCLDILNAPDDSDIGYFIEVDLKSSNIIKKKTRNFPFARVNKICSQDKFIAYIEKTKPGTYISNKS